MTFAHPSVAFVALAAIPLLALAFLASWRARRRLIAAFVPKRLQETLTVGISPARATFRASLLTLAISLALLALARPRLGAGSVEVRQRGLDILVAIDTSRSMLAEDAGPGVSRLQRAKLAALDLAQRARKDRIGLIAFAGSAFLQCPLTIDFEAFRQSVDALDTSVIQQGGTAIGPAIHTAIDAVSDESQNVRVLVLFTDGEEHENSALDAARRAQDKGLRIYTLGVGSTQGELIQLRDENNTVSYLKDSKGNVVKSSLNEQLLTQVASLSGGFYLPLQGPRVMSELYSRALEPLPKSDYAARVMEEFIERFQVPLALALLLLLWETLLPETARVGPRIRPSRRQHPTLSSSPTLAILTGALLALPLLAPPTASAAPSPSTALRHYQNGDFTRAQSDFEALAKSQPADPRLRFNAGAAAYRAGNLEAASRHFLDALASPDLQLQSDAFYNLGNTQFRVGETAQDPKTRQQAWEQAVRAFEAALELAPAHTNANHNLDYVRQRLEDLKQQQQQQQQQQQGDQPQKNQDQDKDQDKNQDPNQNSQENNQPQDNPSQQQNQDPQDSQPSQEPPRDSPAEGPQEQQQPGDQSDRPKDASNPSADTQSPDAGPQPSEPGRESGNPAASDQAPPGQMSPQQALRLLDASKGEEKLMPLDKRRARPRSLKDW